MKWYTFDNKDYLNVTESTRWLATDGKKIWVMYTDKDAIYFCSDTNENESGIEKRLSHWTWLENIPLPYDGLMKWISVKESLPELEQRVLTYEEGFSGEEIEIHYMWDINEYDRSKARKPEKYPPQIRWYRDGGSGNPTHWMPLPDLPKDCTCSEDPNEKRHTYSCQLSNSKRPFEE